MSSSLQHYKLTVSYNGSRFQGFQRQMAQPKAGSSRPTKQPRRIDDDNDAKMASDSSTTLKKPQKGVPLTVQDCLEQAMLHYIHHNSPSPSFSLTDLRLRVSGRTDKGVHAVGQVVTVLMPTTIQPLLGTLRAALNSRLPDDIVIRRIERVKMDSFHPRTNAIQKTYSYTLTFRRVNEPRRTTQLPKGAGIHSFRKPFAVGIPLWNVPWPLNTAHWQEIATVLQGTHDFTPFVHKDERHETHERTVLEIAFDIAHDNVCLDFPGTSVVTATWKFTASGFARGMVRHLMGFIVHVSKWQPIQGEETNGNTTKEPPLPLSSLWQDLASSSSSSSYFASLIHTAPASGLCLEQVLYDDKTVVEP